MNQLLPPNATFKSEHAVPDEYAMETDRLRIAYLKNNLKISGPWYDAGWGRSLIRNVLEDWTGVSPSTFDVDLNISKIPIVDNIFNVVTHLEVIEHLLNPLFAMQEVARVLRPEGRLYLTTPNDYSLIYKLEHLLERKYEPHFHQFSERDLRWLLDAAGLDVIRLETFKRSWRGKIARFCRNSFYAEARKR